MNADNPSAYPIVGVLALQGAFREHRRALEKCGAQTREVRRRHELTGLDALVIPGGESTTIGKLMVSYGLLEPVRGLAREGLPVFGTCAGLVMLAGEVVEGDQPLLEVMEVKVRRNAFGRQVNSFETPLGLPALPGGQPFPGVFIRAPWIEQAGPGVELLASHEGRPVAARQGNLLATAFHPELTDDLRLHDFFLDLVSSR
ncbi:MAG: pyridoxal 5'-phosphate synthase glutaminase subunit PdxT [Thermoleophilia bacterium]|nr:pyridoxal 5'-phosphate synthase glutaminase subunit PdxT [Thermoleophilia bacterium]